MFELGRELKRIFAPGSTRDGLCVGDPALLELLDLNLLQAEGRAADVAAGRIGARDRGQRLVEAAVVWREFARRSGDPAALRKAASCAEQAAKIARSQGKSQLMTAALCEQAQAALLGADLFAESGLTAAAEFVLTQVQGVPAAQALQAGVLARRASADADADAVRTAAAGFDRLITAQQGRRGQGPLAVARLRCDRAEFLIACGGRLIEPWMIHEALSDLDAAARLLDAAYHPVSLARVFEARGEARLRLADISGDVAPVLDAIAAFQAGIELIAPDHSPLDWCRLQHRLGLAQLALAEAGDSEAGFDRALQAFSKALAALDGGPGLALRTLVAQDRAACLVRRAELSGDGYALDEAEAVLRSELSVLRHPVDPVAWAVLQLNLANVYLAQARATGRDRGERARAGEALLAAFEVFAEHGLRSLTVAAESGLRRIREEAAEPRR